MDLEASIVERLEKLRQWQIEQQERLLKQQQMQREMLTQKQDCLYKALELSIQELDIGERKYSFGDAEGRLEMNMQQLATMGGMLRVEDDYADRSECETSRIEKDSSSPGSFTSQQHSNELNTPVKKFINGDNNIRDASMDKVVCNMKNYKNLAFTPEKQEKQIAEFLIEGVTPLPLEKTVINRVSIDDVPIPSPKKDFHTLLEERLKDCEDVPQVQAKTDPRIKTKKPFLRKGEGLSRFRLNRNAQSPSTNIRPRSRSLSCTSRSDSKCSKSQSTKQKDTGDSSRNSQSRKSISFGNTAQQQLSLKNVPLPRKKIRSKSESVSSGERLNNSIGQTKNAPELNTSDYQSKAQKEKEEVRIFELLEEKAENSSFCSTSSAVVAFLQQSTPFKMRKKLNCSETGVVNARQQNSPILKGVKDHSVLKKISHYEVSKGCQTTHPPVRSTILNNNSEWNSIMSVNQNEVKSVAMNNRMAQDIYSSVKISHDLDGSGKGNTSIKKHASVKNQFLHAHNQQNSCDISNSVASDVDVSFHVRFSEYNEYKTIGLTDTSSISNESSMIETFSDDKVWNDSFTSEASDVQVLSIKRDASQSPQIIGIQNDNHKSISVQCNVSKELNYRTKSPENVCQDNDFIYDKQLHENVHSNDDESEFSDTVDQSSDDGHSIADQYNQNSTLETDENSHETEKLKRIVEGKSTDDLSKYTSSVPERNGEDEDNVQETNATIFKSELLKNRLLELEQEIDIFRKENAALNVQRQKLQEDQRKLHREFVEREKNLEENRRQEENRLQEERKKLMREKAALESRLRDSQEKAQQTKLEREKVQTLKEELEKLKEDMNIKESRWNAAQSRHKCQMRILRAENVKLKQEIERLQSSKKHNARSRIKPSALSNTKAIHQINKQLNMQKETHRVLDNSSSDSDSKLVDSMMQAIGGRTSTKDVDHRISHNIKNGDDHERNRSNIYEASQKPQQNIVSVAKKRNLYENLLKEATADLRGNQDEFNNSHNTNASKSEIDDRPKKLDKKKNTMQDYYTSETSDNTTSSDSTGTDSNVQLHVENHDAPFISPVKRSQEKHDSKLIATQSDELPLNTQGKNTPLPSQTNSKVDKQGTRHIQHSDGRIEYWYSNGNVKKIFPDQGITKMIYYNGDVRETDNDGKIKYFYASTRTWHTTMPDGLEVLEFPDGQVEKRLHDGTVEVSFPDGSIRIVQSDGTEKWVLIDGTIVQTFPNGEKILTLPNGQREIHTKAHKKREYPDGTVKLVYPDGTQETRYSNGRTRLKDKDGNLLMDSYE